jgi:hypothetical protein
MKDKIDLQRKIIEDIERERGITITSRNLTKISTVASAVKKSFSKEISNKQETSSSQWLW